MSDRIEKVHALADGELSDSEALEVSEALKGDSGLAKEYQWAAFLPGFLRSRCVPVECEEAWKAAVARLDALDAVRGDSRVDGYVGKWSWAFAACLFVVIVFAGLMNRGSVGQVDGQQLAGVLGTSSGAVGDSSAATKLLNERLGGDVSSIVEVTGIAEGTINGRPFARVSMVDGSGPVVFIVVDSARGFDGFTTLDGRKEYVGGKLNGMNCCGWSADGRAYLVCGERSTDALISLCDQLRFK